MLYIRRLNNRRILPYLTLIHSCQAELAYKGLAIRVHSWAVTA